MKGHVAYWYSEGFGFLKVDGLETDVWCHYTAVVGLAERARYVRRGTVVSFDLCRSPRGYQAANVRVLEEKLVRESTPAAVPKDKGTSLTKDQRGQIAEITTKIMGPEARSKWLDMQRRRDLSFEEILSEAKLMASEEENDGS